MDNTNNFSQVDFRRLSIDDIEPLRDYLHNLSQETKSRFGPHEFDRATLDNLFIHNNEHLAYIGVLRNTGRVMAYVLVKKGFLEHDGPRLRSYGLTLSHETDCTYAPSVADDWQGKGVGTIIFEKILPELRLLGYKRIILWGGVQSDNSKAVAYYNKLGFISLGQFEFHGLNTDMICQIH